MNLGIIPRFDLFFWQSVATKKNGQGEYLVFLLEGDIPFIFLGEPLHGLKPITMVAAFIGFATLRQAVHNGELFGGIVPDDDKYGISFFLYVHGNDAHTWIGNGINGFDRVVQSVP